MKGYCEKIRPAEPAPSGTWLSAPRSSRANWRARARWKSRKTNEIHMYGFRQSVWLRFGSSESSPRGFQLNFEFTQSHELAFPLSVSSLLLFETRARAVSRFSEKFGEPMNSRFFPTGGERGIGKIRYAADCSEFVGNFYYFQSGRPDAVRVACVYVCIYIYGAGYMSLKITADGKIFFWWRRQFGRWYSKEFRLSSGNQNSNVVRWNIDISLLKHSFHFILK